LRPDRRLEGHPFPAVAAALAGQSRGRRLRYRLPRPAQRKVRVALARGTALGPEEVFGTPNKAMFRMVGSWKEHASALRYLNFSAQSCSIGEYLGGTGATDERRDRFGAFLEAIGPKGL